MTLATALVVAFAGMAIGATSLGGALVVPALTDLSGASVPTALAASSFAFLLTGVVALQGLGADRRSTWEALRILLVAALVGAALGAWMSDRVPAQALRTWVGLLALTSGLLALWTERVAAAPSAVPDAHTGRGTGWPSPSRQAMIGLGVGLGSALSGTGGPLVLLPVLMFLRTPVRAAVAAAQIVQMPVALAASAAHIGAGRLDPTLGVGVAVVLVAGAWLGRRVAVDVPPRRLRIATAGVLVATGLFYALP